jgi:kynureninase
MEKIMTGALNHEINRESCVALDKTDALSHTRERFDIADDVIYLDGNSLGALPRSAAASVAEVTALQWGRDLIRPWNKHQWINLPQKLGAKIAPLIGAKASEVIVADSTSVNLFKLLAALLQMPRVQDDNHRRVIISERGNFPTDLYIAKGLNTLLGNRFALTLLDAGDIKKSFGPTVAAALITHVDYRTGYVHDMAQLNAAAKNAGTTIIWDLSHSTGAIPIDVNRDGTELAIGCSYKYLNGGPGAPAYLYAAKNLQPQLTTPLSGWLGHAAPFDFLADYAPAAGMDRFLCGTHSAIAFAALECGLDTFENVSILDIRKKSLALSDLFWQLMDEHCGQFGFKCVSPREHDQRASHLSFAHADGYAIMQALIERNVIGDFRQPNLLRFGFTPLYTRYVDVWDAVATIREVMESGDWKAAKFQTRNAVT